MKKIFTILLVLCISLNCLPVITSVAATNPSFQLKQSVSGDLLTLTVKLDQKISNVGGLHFTLTFDADKLSYTTGSRKILIPNLSNSNAGKDIASNGEIDFVIDNQTGFTIKDKVASYQFKIVGAQSSNIQLSVQEFYYLDANLTSIVLAKNDAQITVAGSSSAVANVINLINNIQSPVTLQSKEAIDAARTAYDSLKTAQKRQVSNLQILVDAENTYAQLLQEKKQQEYEVLAEAFRQCHSDILSKKLDTVAIEDEAKVIAAIEDYTDENVNVRILLSDDKFHLNLLQSRITELKKIAEDAAYEKQLQDEAKKTAEEWLGKWDVVLKTKESELVADHEKPLTQAIGEADGYAVLNTYVMPLIQKEYDQLKQMLEKVKNLTDNSGDSSNALADRFLSSYGYLLNLTEADVSEDMLVDLSTAIALYDMLSPEAQEQIGSDALSKLQSLLAAAQAISDEGADVGYGDDNVGNSQVIIEEKVVTVEQDGKKLQVFRGQIAPLVKWLLLATAITVLLDLLAAGILIFVSKSKYFAEKRGDASC